jgi:hypothetical protein
MTQSDPIYRKAQERLATIERERQQLESFLRTYDQLSAGAASPPTAEAWTYVSKEVRQQPVGKRWPAAKILELALEILADHKRPMKLSTLYSAVVARGAVIGGQNPTNNFGAMLSSDKVRLATGPQGWWFRDEPPPPPLEDLDRIDEGLEADAPRPSQSNGAADHHSA